MGLSVAEGRVMSQFWLGYVAAISTYLFIGLCFSFYIIISNLAVFFSAGWQWRRMLKTIAIYVPLWPSHFTG
jgi:hypothetical protein